jgi:hypothetical protein
MGGIPFHVIVSVFSIFIKTAKLVKYKYIERVGFLPANRVFSRLTRTGKKF